MRQAQRPFRIPHGLNSLDTSHRNAALSHIVLENVKKRNRLAWWPPSTTGGRPTTSLWSVLTSMVVWHSAGNYRILRWQRWSWLGTQRFSRPSIAPRRTMTSLGTKQPCYFGLSKQKRGPKKLSWESDDLAAHGSADQGLQNSGFRWWRDYVGNRRRCYGG